MAQDDQECGRGQRGTKAHSSLTGTGFSEERFQDVQGPAVETDGKALKDHKAEPRDTGAHQPFALRARSPRQQGPQRQKKRNQDWEKPPGSRETEHQSGTADDVIAECRCSRAVEAIPRQEREADPAQDNPAECCP